MYYLFKEPYLKSMPLPPITFVSVGPLPLHHDTPKAIPSHSPQEAPSLPTRVSTRLTVQCCDRQLSYSELLLL